MPKWKLIIEYQGTRYRGWQEQPNAKTVQREIRAAAEDVFGERLEIMGAGRTDAGVHALYQVAHLSAKRFLRAVDLKNQINDRLPQDINIKDIREVDSRFHARHDAIERYYLYQISTRRRALSKPFVWWIKDRLNVATMTEVAGMFEGRHDFGAFCDKDDVDASSLVEVTLSEISCENELILFRIGASHFLWKMVRRLVGVLVEVGRGNLDGDRIEQLLKTPSSSVAQWTAPPSGLFLEYIRYKNDKPVNRISPAFHLL
jgi:tRNA pseudouridine38-40 synthase